MKQRASMTGGREGRRSLAFLEYHASIYKVVKEKALGQYY
jgi:hypothetical protein